jgi:hypothetical protein
MSSSDLTWLRDYPSRQLSRRLPLVAITLIAMELVTGNQRSGVPPTDLRL